MGGMEEGIKKSQLTGWGHALDWKAHSHLLLCCLSPCPLDSTLLGNDSRNLTPGLWAPGHLLGVQPSTLVCSPAPTLFSPGSSPSSHLSAAPAGFGASATTLIRTLLALPSWEVFREQRGQSGREMCLLTITSGEEQVEGGKSLQGHRVMCLGASPLSDVHYHCERTLVLQIFTECLPHSGVQRRT